MSGELEHLIRLWRLAEMGRDMIVINVVHSRLGRLIYVMLEEAVTRG